MKLRRSVFCVFVRISNILVNSGSRKKTYNGSYLFISGDSERLLCTVPDEH